MKGVIVENLEIIFWWLSGFEEIKGDYVILGFFYYVFKKMEKYFFFKFLIDKYKLYGYKDRK